MLKPGHGTGNTMGKWQTHHQFAGTSNSGLSYFTCHYLLFKAFKQLFHAFCPGFVQVIVREMGYHVITPSHLEVELFQASALRVYSLGLINFYCKGLESKYLRLWGPHMISYNSLKDHSKFTSTKQTTEPLFANSYARIHYLSLNIWKCIQRQVVVWVTLYTTLTN